MTHYDNDFSWLHLSFPDRYLQKSFSIAFSHAKPDVVVFLGDLLDEGSQASPEDYQFYMKRFRHIFNIPSDVQVTMSFIIWNTKFGRLALWIKE